MKDTALGIASTVEVSFEKSVIITIPSKFKGKSLQGESQYRKSSNLYELNLILALGTMASGIGPINMAQLLSFLDLSNCKTLNGRFFKNMELSIGSILSKAALESMEEATEEEGRLTINNDEQQKEFDKGNLPLGISVSFDMG